LFCASVAAFLCAAGSAAAATATSTFTVTITITSACTVTTTSNMAFASTGLLNAAVNATAGFNVTCSTGTSYAIGLDNGSNVSGSQRRMKGGASNSEYISYNLYSDSNHTVVWDNTTTVSGTGSGSAQSLIVYGQVPVQTTPSAASNYTDTVTVTVTY